eukprot:Sdes_comp18077_c0_seq1m7491
MAEEKSNSKLDMSLDDIVSSNRKNRSQTQRVGNRGKFNGNSSQGIQKRYARNGNQQFSRPAPKWKHDKFETGFARNILGQSLSTGAKLLFSNLHSDVTEQDLKDLCEDFGAIKKACIFYDSQGRSLGTAEIVFSHKSDAIRAMKQYNNVELDGLPMIIQLVTSGNNFVETPQRETHSNQFRSVKPQSNPRNGRFLTKSKSEAAEKKRNQKPKPKTAEDLDAEIDSYMSSHVESSNSAA